MVTIPLRTARRLALLRAGLLRPDLIALPMRAAGTGRRARRAAHRVIDHFGYLQLDTVSVAGEKLVARVDLKAERQAGRLLLKALHFEQTTSSSRDRSAVDSALARLAAALALELVR